MNHKDARLLEVRDDDREINSCPVCKSNNLIELTNKIIRGGVLFCQQCRAISPFAETTTEAMFLWDKAMSMTELNNNLYHCTAGYIDIVD